MNTHFLILFENVWTTTLWILIAYYLYRRKFFYSL
jgi:heparan-alpha-glucosaminide N-acetyltransferase